MLKKIGLWFVVLACVIYVLFLITLLFNVVVVADTVFGKAIGFCALIGCLLLILDNLIHKERYEHDDYLEHFKE